MILYRHWLFGALVAISGCSGDPEATSEPTGSASAAGAGAAGLAATAGSSAAAEAGAGAIAGAETTANAGQTSPGAAGAEQAAGTDFSGAGQPGGAAGAAEAGAAGAPEASGGASDAAGADAAGADSAGADSAGASGATGAAGTGSDLSGDAGAGSENAAGAANPSAGAGGSGAGDANSSAGAAGDPDPASTSALAEAYPCPGDPTGYDAVVEGGGSSWTITRGAQSTTATNMLSAMQQGVDSLSGGRTTIESVLVLGDGEISATSRLNMPSYTRLNVCGTINVAGEASGDNAPVYGRGRTDIEIPNLHVTGTPGYGMFFRNVDNLHLGHIRLDLASGLGIRIDNHGDRARRATGIAVDFVEVQGASNHGVETYGVDGLVVGTVIARDVGYSGLLLNDTVNAEVGLVDGDNVATGQGYAVFRMANGNGKLTDGTYPTNVHVGRVIARGGGRGVFCVSESGGAAIDFVDLEDTGNNSVLIENCYNVTLGHPTTQSRIANSGELRLAARDEFANNRDITIQNIAVSGTSVRESPCGENTTWSGVVTSGAYDVCD